MKKVIIIVTLLLLIFLGFSMMYLKSDKYSTSITIQEVPDILKIDYVPSLPTKWEIQSIEKYDDGFTSPSVNIEYINGVTIRLSSSNMSLSDDFKSDHSVMFGNKQAKHYYNANEDAYTFRLSSISYLVKSPNNLRSETEEVLAELLNASNE